MLAPHVETMSAGEEQEERFACAGDGGRRAGMTSPAPPPQSLRHVGNGFESRRAGEQAGPDFPEPQPPPLSWSGFCFCLFFSFFFFLVFFGFCPVSNCFWPLLQRAHTHTRFIDQS